MAAQSALPHKKLADDASWQVHTDHVSLVVQPGLRPSLTGDAVSVGVPYGSRARLICLYLQSEALKTNSREIELGKTLHAWLRKLDIPIGGKSMAAVRDQAERISRCRMSFQIKQGNRTGLVNQSILDTAMFVEDDTTQGSLFIEKAKLSEMFFEQLKKHPVPIEERAIAPDAVKWANNSNGTIDVYCWLAYRLHALPGPKLVTWKALHAQFGRGLARLDHFRWYFGQTLEAGNGGVCSRRPCGGRWPRPDPQPVARSRGAEGVVARSQKAESLGFLASRGASVPRRVQPNRKVGLLGREASQKGARRRVITQWRTAALGRARSQ